jgi:hypothetical protein
MLPSSAMHGVYDPDTLKAMGAAFDTAVQSIPPHLQDHERARRRLALLIVRPGSPSGSPGGMSRGGDTRSRRARRFSPRPHDSGAQS